MVIIGEDSPLLAPDAQIAVRVGATETWVPLTHLHALIHALNREKLQAFADDWNPPAPPTPAELPA